MRSSPTGVILAGGRATRLGPLAAQLNKSLVTVGQKPMLVRHAQLLWEAGCHTVIVVVSPAQKQQVWDVVERAGLEGVKVVVQDFPHGPTEALASAAQYAEGDAYVIFADTLVDAIDLEPDTVAVSIAPTERRWCHFANGRWVEEDVPAGQAVAIGLYRFSAIQNFRDVRTRFGDEGEMSVALNGYDVPLAQKTVHGWHDVGDLGALARTRREHFISRSFNQLELSPTGIVTKRGGGSDFVDELDFMDDVATAQSMRDPLGDLYPRVVELDYEANEYRLEHVDLPTLAELWLYWPMRPDTWQWMLGELETAMTRDHWWSRTATRSSQLEFRKSTYGRWNSWVHPVKKYDEIEINGAKHVAGALLFQELLGKMKSGQPAFTHGDLNFTNVMCSLGSGYFKLLDPRKTMQTLDYDLAKLRYSWHGGFPAITHGLFDVSGGLDTWVLDVWPKREPEIEALEQTALQDESTKALEALLFINGAALHTGAERVAMYLRGVEVGNAALEG